MSSEEIEAAVPHHYTVARASDHNNAPSYTPSSSSFHHHNHHHHQHHHHPVLDLERLSPPNSSTSSTAGEGPGQQSSTSSSSFLQTTHPSTPQDLNIGGNGYFYSPAQTPYKLEGSPIVDRHSNYELSTSNSPALPVGLCDRNGDGGGMVEWKSDVNQFDLFNPPRSAMFLKDDDLMGGEGYMLTDHHYMDSRDNGDHVCDAWERIDHTLPSPTPSEDVLESLSGSINTAVAAGKDKQGPKPKAVRAPRKRKAPGEKADRLKLPKLTKPLSELTRDYHHLPVRNMESWVTRSAETRWQEVEKRGGYVTRPMNSFMLYRSAYAERTKLWCLQNNHQVVSSVSGESWPLEPPAVREKYNEMAKLERFNHQAAHPGYKFSPSKAQNNSRKRKCSKAAAEEKAAGAEGDITDLDDLDLGLDLALVGSASSSSAKKPPASRKRPQKSTGAGAGVGTGVGAGVGAGAAGNNSLVYLNFPYDLEAGGAHRSSFNHTNPGKTPPACMGTQDMAGQYYQTTVRASSSAVPISNLDGSAVIEDVTIRRAQAPGSGSHYIPQQPRTHVKTEAFDDGDDNSNVDPLLLGDQYQLLPSHYMHDPNGGGDGDGSRAVDFEPLFASQILESAGTEGPFDAEFVRELPGYCDDMEGFLDDVEPWAVEGADGAELCYDEWLEGSGV